MLYKYIKSKYNYYTKRRKLQSGFTIIETLVVIAIFTVVLLTFLSIYDWSYKNYLYQEAKVLSSTSARQSLTEIHNLVLQTHRVLDSHLVNGATYNSGSGSLVLQIPSINSEGDVINNTWDYAAFYVANSSLYKELEPNVLSSRVPVNSKLLSDSVRSVIFEYDNVDYSQVVRVDIDLETGFNIRGQVVGTRMLQEVYLRNR